MFIPTWYNMIRIKIKISRIILRASGGGNIARDIEMALTT